MLFLGQKQGVFISMPPSDQKLIGLERSERLFANLKIVFKLGSNLSRLKNAD